MPESALSTVSPVRLGAHLVSRPIVLAPMAGVTDRPFRILCKRLGADLAVSEMITSNSALYASKKTLTRMDHQGEVEPVIVQIAGGDVDMMVQAARLNEQQGADVIDINMGCPAKKVCNKAAGSALLSDEDLVRKILYAVVNSVSVPVTLKIRTGPDRANKNGVKIAQIAEQCGVAMLSVHGRTRADKFLGEAEYETIAEIVQSVAMPVLANGDINTPEDAARVLEKTDAAGVMIGRAAQGNPWIFRETRHYFDTGEHAAPPGDVEKARVLKWHLENLYDLYGEFSGVRIARKHIAWYCKGKPQAAEFRQRVYRVESAEEQLAHVEQFFLGDNPAISHLSDSVDNGTDDKAGRDRAGKDNARQDPARQDHARQDSARQDSARQDNAGPIERSSVRVSTSAGPNS